jgi:hypothetical protein
MKTRIAMIESLESRQFLSVSPIHLAAAAHSMGPAVTVAPHAGRNASLVTITDYTGTAVNQDDRSSAITLEVTDTNGVRTGVVNINNNDGGTTPIPFKIGAAGAISFDFTVGDQKVKATGRLSANGETISGAWKSVADRGKLGHGEFTGTQT